MAAAVSMPGGRDGDESGLLAIKLVMPGLVPGIHVFT
jgi:hypothetical protein